MRAISPRALSIVFALIATALWAQPPASQNEEGGVARVVRGFASCSRCHDRSTSSRTLPGGNVVRGDDWILGRECGIWAEHDHHVQAFSVLLNARSQEMARIMDVVDTRGNSQVHRDLRCLACHTGYPMAQIERDASGAPLCSEAAFKVLDVNQGVSCEGCHGPSGTGAERGWFDPHTTADNGFQVDGQKHVWRYLSPQTKLKEFGYVDVRSPFERAKMCASCHIGDAKSGRFVTHEMFAAGHPPLPAFEAENFLDQMPRHGRSIRDKSSLAGGTLVSDFLAHTQDPHLARFRSKAAPSSDYVQSFERTRAMVVGQLAVFHQSLQLTADLAKTDSPFPKGIAQPVWPDMASFDCYACHHELRYQGWRQTRGLNTKPGRPKIHEWPLAFVHFLADKRDDGRLASVLSELEMALSARPFGDRKRLVSACNNATDWAERAADKESKVKFDRDGADQLRLDIADYCSTVTLDYDSARAMVWAFVAVDQELRSRATSSDRAEPGIVVNALRNYQEGPLSEPMTRLSQTLNLDMRKRRPEQLADTTKTVLDETEQREVGSVPLPEILPLIDKYDPAKFKQAFRSLRKGSSVRRIRLVVPAP